MKSAYELAMERLNKTGPRVQLTADQRKQLAELDSQYAAKIAEREIFLTDGIAKAMAKGDPAEAEQLHQQLTSSRRTLQADLEEKKEKVRQGGSR